MSDDFATSRGSIGFLKRCSLISSVEKLPLYIFLVDLLIDTGVPSAYKLGFRASPVFFLSSIVVSMKNNLNLRNGLSRIEDEVSLYKLNY